MPSSIINSDDGVVSGTSGLKSSGGDDGVLVFQSKGTETIRINTDKQIVAAAGTNSLPALTTTGDLNTGIYFPAADTIAFTEGGAEAMRIDSSSRLLVGATSARSQWDNGTIGSNLLQVERAGSGLNASISIAADGGTGTGAEPVLFLGLSGGTSLGSVTAVASGDLLGRVSFQGTDGTDMVEGAAITAAVDGTPGANDMPGRLVFKTTADGASSSTERMRIDSNGNVGIGTTSPSTRLDVRGSTGSMSLTATTGTNRCSFLFENTGGAFQFGIDNSEGLYFGSPAPAYAVNFQYTGNYPMLFWTNSIERMRIAGDGTITFKAYGAGTLSTNASGVISASDGRYKTKTRSIDTALPIIESLQPTYFRWHEDSPFASEYEELGFVAQEVAEVIPEASPGEDEEGKYRNYHDRAILAMLVKGVQELKAINDAQAQRIETLETKVAALEAK